MFLELVQLQSRKPAPEPSQSFAMGAVVGVIIALFLMLAMIAGGIYVILKWRGAGAGRYGFGVPLMLLPCTGIIVFGLASIANVKLPDTAFLVVPGGWLAWIVLMFIAQRSIKRQSEETEAAEIAERQAELARWGTSEDDVDPDLVDAAEAAAAPAAEESHPRRAITLPANESDGRSRASEQTLKRVSSAKIAADAKLKAPRADEIAGNPILPDGEVKIRCLACDKKMKADSSKFRKQRRCPFCKVEPFRYVTAV